MRPIGQIFPVCTHIKHVNHISLSGFLKAKRQNISYSNKRERINTDTKMMRKMEQIMPVFI